MKASFEAPTAANAQELKALFAALVLSGDEVSFRPHPMTDAYVDWLISYGGRDVYVVVMEDGRATGYGLLRGWDAGYAIPSLGIAVHPEARGRGVAKALMSHLHDVARQRGADSVRLRVYPENVMARDLYAALGYGFASQLEEGQLVGMLDLAGAVPGVA